MKIRSAARNAGRPGGRFRVLSTSRLTSRIRQKNIHNEREYGAGVFFQGNPRAIHENRSSSPSPSPPIRGKTWKNGPEAASFSSFSMLSRPKFPLAYIFLIKVILAAGLHGYVEFINERGARMFIRLYRISSSNFTHQDPPPYSYFIHPCFFSQFPPLSRIQRSIVSKYRGRVSPAVINPRFRRSSSARSLFSRSQNQQLKIKNREQVNHFRFLSLSLSLELL